MGLKEILSELFELEDARQEAEKKLVGTYVIVDGSIVFISEFDFDKDCLVGSYEDKKHISYGKGFVAIKNIKKLEFFLPEAGIYKLDANKFVLITKVPKRQWARSYKDDYYVSKFLHGTPYKGWLQDLYLVHNKKENLHETKTHGIYFLNKKIGYRNKKNVIVCEDANYEQELIDWSKYGNSKNIIT